MATATRSPLIEQAERLGTLAGYLSEGRLLEQVLRMAQASDVWTGPVQQAFLAWLQFGVDGWIRNQLATGVRLVAESLQKRAEQINSAAQAVAAGTATTVTVPPPAPLNYSPGRPPPFGDIGGGKDNNFHAERMTELVRLLETTADDSVVTFGRGLRSALEPRLPPPTAPAAPPATSPLPPDAAAAVGEPDSSSPGSNVYLALAEELHRAADDISRRIRALRLLDEPLESTTMDPNLTANVGAGAAALLSDSETAEEQAATPDTPTANPEYRGPAPVNEKPPPTQEQIEKANREGDALAEQALRDDVLNHPDKLAEIVHGMNAHRGDPAAEAFAAAFVEKFGAERMRQVPRTLQAWQYNYTAGNPGASYYPPKHTLPLGEPKRKPDQTEIEDILYSFSATLATSTHAEGRPKLDAELDKLAHDEKDPLALSWLLTNHDADFDADFLMNVFDTGVKKVIEWEARERKPYSEAGMGGEIGLGVEGDRLLDRNPKVAVLNAISHNPEAAYRLQTEFQPFTLEVYHQTSEVRIDSIAKLLYQGGEYGGYGDNGSAMGRALDAIHRSLLQEGNAPEAQRLVEQITNSATDDHEVERAQTYLAKIGARHPTDGPAAQAALDTVRQNPKHPSRELLLGQMAQVHETAKAFAEAAGAASRNKVKEDKSPELRSIRETEGAWNVIPVLQHDPSTTNLAETLTEHGIHQAAKGELNDPARRGLAKAISSNSAGFALSVTAVLSAPKGAQASTQTAEAEGIQISADEFAAAVAELMHDPEAKRTIEAGAGNLTGSWADQAAASHIDALLGRPLEPVQRQVLAQRSKELGNYLCAVIKAETKAAENKAQAAVDALMGMRIGANIFSMGLDFASGFVPGGKIASTTGKFLFNKAVDIGKGGTGIEGLPLGLEGGLNGVMEDELKSQEDAARAQSKLEVADALPMAREFVRDAVAGGLLQQTLLRSSPDREEALRQLGIDATMIRDAGLLDSNGRVKIPLRGAAEYTGYTNFLRNNPALGGAITEATEGVADNFTECMNTALLLKTTGK